MSTRQNRKISLIFVLVITLTAFACVRPTASDTTYVPGDDDNAPLSSAPVISNVNVIDTTESNATVRWHTDEPATGQVEYGKTRFNTTLDETLSGFHEVFLSALESETIYFFRVKSKNASGEEAISKGYTFATARSEEITVNFTGSTYEPVTEKPTGWFETGQDADIVLNWFGFNNSGGPLSFNHPASIATDGEHLLLADTWNNRILIWNNLPEGNEPPDVVLGQKDFNSSDSGIGTNKFNWPIGVATDGEHVIVTDTYNNRVLIWNGFPTENGEPADLVLGVPDFTTIGDVPWPRPESWQKKYLIWPWAVWTDGQKLIITSTATASVLIWNNFPTENNQPASIILTGGGDFGTPRAIGSDGTCLVIGDHNPKPGKEPTFFWKEFPTTDDEPYDFFMANPADRLAGLMWGLVFTSDGKFLALGGPKLLIWNAFPENKADEPDLVLDYPFEWGDGGGIAVAGERVYISMPNGHRIVAFKSVPTRADQSPDFSIGSQDIYTNPLAENYFMGNPAVACDGEHLFAVSDFNQKMCVWKSLPDESGAKPDIVYSLDLAPWDIALHNGILAIAGRQSIYIWNAAPLNGELPDVILGPRIGSAEFHSICGVALDDEYFYISDEELGKIYVWQGIPDESRDPDYTIEVRPHIRRLSSDGKHLAVACNEGQAVYVFSVEGIPRNEEPITLMDMEGMRFNLPEGVFVDREHLFVADTVSSRILIWNEIPQESNQPPDIVLGEDNFENRYPAQRIDRLFWPGTVCFDGSYLWVGEFKFSNRLVRFPVHSVK